MSDERGVSVPVSIGAQQRPSTSRANIAVIRRTTAARVELVRLSARDLAVVELVAELGQLPAQLIGDICFPGLKSQTPIKRTLKRLTERGLLARLEVRLVGGDGGGSNQLTYQLGRAGGKLLGLAKECPRFSRYDPHMVLTAKCFAKLKELEHAGVLTVLDYKGEDAAYTEVRNLIDGSRIKLTPDLWVDVGVHEPRRRLVLWLEADRGTEHNRVQVADKLRRYVAAYKAWDVTAHGTVFPRVVFVVPDERRMQRIKGDVSRVPAEFRRLFEVGVLTDFPTFLLRAKGELAAMRHGQSVRRST